MHKMRQLRKIKKMTKEVLSALIALSLAIPAPLYAAQVEISEGLDLMADGVSSLTTLSNLPKGTILDIPDEFIIKNSNGTINNNATINNWVNGNFIKPRSYDKDGRIQNDYFFRVKVVSTPNGDKNINGQYGFVALKNIALKDGLKLITVEPAPLVSPKEFEPQVAPATSKAKSEYAGIQSDSNEARVCLGDCSQDNSLLGRVKSGLGDILNRVKNTTDRVMAGKRPGKAFDAVVRNFQKACFGVSFDDFANYVKLKAPEQNIPPETMLSIMTQESAGNCGAIGDKTSTSKSVGLFQVNTKTIRNIPACSSSQLSALRGKSIQEMGTNPGLRCLQNPAVNLEAGMKVLKDKYIAVNDGARPTSKLPWSQLSEKEKDNFRKALSAYNGGEKWVFQSQKDIKAAAAKYGIPLNNDWETIRLFFFRHELQAKGLVSARPGGNRKTSNNLINVPYVEAIMGRDSNGQSQNGYTQLWAQALYKSPSISVASAKK